jgi:hypothetical protein
MTAIAAPQFAIKWTSLLLQVLDGVKCTNTIQDVNGISDNSPVDVWPPVADIHLLSLQAKCQSLKQFMVNEITGLLYTIKLRASSRIRHLPLSKVIPECWFDKIIDGNSYIS